VLLLLLVSLIWAFSFGLIKGKLTGLDPAAVGLVRIGLSALVFLPFLRLAGATARQRVQLGATGALQFGAMYILYLHAFKYLQAYEVALFTITTPLFLAFVDSLLERRIQAVHVLAAGLSVAGAAVVVWQQTANSGALRGVFLLQASNLCFAVGQLAYRRIRRRMTDSSDASVFGWLYLGALLAVGIASASGTTWSQFRPTAEQWGVLAYLGILSSGLCFFWWNLGATRVNAGTLAAMNNAKVPLGVACSLLFFGENASWPRLLIGGGLMALAVWLTERRAGAKP
jgi:drug/metabolite transporter (DMT)-like permease